MGQSSFENNSNVPRVIKNKILTTRNDKIINGKIVDFNMSTTINETANDSKFEPIANGVHEKNMIPLKSCDCSVGANIPVDELDTISSRSRNGNAIDELANHKDIELVDKSKADKIDPTSKILNVSQTETSEKKNFTQSNYTHSNGLPNEQNHELEAPTEILRNVDTNVNANVTFNNCYCACDNNDKNTEDAAQHRNTNTQLENNSNSSSIESKFAQMTIDSTIVTTGLNDASDNSVNNFETNDPNSDNSHDVKGDQIRYMEYDSELQMTAIMSLITKDLSEPYSIYTYRYFIHNWPKLCFLAFHQDQCVGAIVCKLDQHKKVVRRGYIAMLAIEEGFRRRGIGSNLVRKAICAMIEDDCDEVVLETEITNKGALNLYENLGFVRDKRLFRYYLNGVDALRLKLWLR